VDALDREDKLEDYVAAARRRMERASGQNEELLALFDGLTGCLSSIAGELALLRNAIEKRNA
jgi:hypothetical protein